MRPLSLSPSPSSPSPAADARTLPSPAVWLAIKDAVYRFIARDVAQNIFSRVGKKLKHDWDEDDDEDEGLFKKPKSVTKAGAFFSRSPRSPSSVRQGLH